MVLRHVICEMNKTGMQTENINGLCVTRGKVSVDDTLCMGSE